MGISRGQMIEELVERDLMSLTLQDLMAEVPEGGTLNYMAAVLHNRYTLEMECKSTTTITEMYKRVFV